jgi:hypothetical protein
MGRRLRLSQEQVVQSIEIPLPRHLIGCTIFEIAVDEATCEDQGHLHCVIVGRAAFLAKDDGRLQKQSRIPYITRIVPTSVDGPSRPMWPIPDDDRGEAFRRVGLPVEDVCPDREDVLAGRFGVPN